MENRIFMEMPYETGVFKTTDNVAQGVLIPVLAYHSVCENPPGNPVYSVHISDMEEQLRLLLESGYTPITFEELMNVEKIKNPVMLTFDDGYEDNYDNLFPLLKKYQVKVTLSMIAEKIGANGYLNSVQLLEMSNSGFVSVQSHGMTHTYLDQIDTTQLETELAESQKQIAELTKAKPFVFTYPMECYSREVIRRVKDYYSFGLGCNEVQGVCWITGERNYTIPRFFISRGMTAGEILDAISMTNSAENQIADKY